MSKHSDYQSSPIKALHPSVNQRSDWRGLACQRISDCDCGMKCVLGGIGAAANLKCVAKRPFGNLLVVNL